MLLQIDTGYACAGVEVDSNEIVRAAAPIFSWMVGKSFNEIRRWKHIKSIKGWTGKGRKTSE